MKTPRIFGLLAGLGIVGLSAGLAMPSYAQSVSQAEKDAARFLSKATFGPDMALIQEVVAKGNRAWLEDQLRLPPTLHRSFTLAAARLIDQVTDQQLERLSDDEDLSELQEEKVFELYEDLHYWNRRFAWWQRTMTAPDQVRQRVVFALSEVFVVSDFSIEDSQGLASYYDILVRGALGNYEDMFLEVVQSPVMGFYLSHFNNARSDPSVGRFPDENFAREAMQLFSIGLYELEANGERKLDENGQPIPTYSNLEITEFAKIFTGFGDGGEEGEFGNEEPDFTVPMKMYEAFHEPGEKRLLRGRVVPGGQSAMKDVRDAVDNLFNHPNVGPFVGHKLIQRLVTSNPSPAYIGRVSAAFNNNGQGVRGDMKAVVSAILLDPEAQQLAASEDANFGHLQEPILRYAGLLRAFKARSPIGYYVEPGERLQELLRQHPLSSPSVFNFFLPDHQPIGPITDRGLVAPEFQITTSSSIVNTANFLDEVLEGEVMEQPELSLICLMRPKKCDDLILCVSESCHEREEDYLFEEVGPEALEVFRVRFNFDQETELAQSNVPALIDRLDLLLSQGRMSAETKQTIRQAVMTLGNTDQRLRLAMYLTLLSPDAAVAN